MAGSKATGGAPFLVIKKMHDSAASLLPVLPPPWSCAFSEDEKGVFAEFEVEKVVFSLRWICSGRFEMGSPEGEKGRWGSESPPHEVMLSGGFWMGTTPVTQEQWEAVMGGGAEAQQFRR